MSDLTLFLGKFLRHGTAIASLAPSSRWLARATVRNVDWSRSRIVVELGAGTGPITRVIAERARPETRVLVVERDPDFLQRLHERFEAVANLEIIDADACDLGRLLAERGIQQVDHIISGLPVPSFSQPRQRQLFRAVREALSPEGSYNQITELALVYWPLYRRYFGSVEFVFEPRNLPPAGAYLCRHAREVA